MLFFNSFGAKFQTTFVVCFVFFNKLFDLKEIYTLYVKLKNWMTNNVDPDETAHYEPSHLDLCCLQKPIIIACGSVRVKAKIIDIFLISSQKHMWVLLEAPWCGTSSEYP